MTSDSIQELIAQYKVGATAYVRNLSIAEDAVQKGHLNIAKVLRAAAHTQRILAMDAARLMVGKTDSILDSGYWLNNHDRGLLAQIKNYADTIGIFLI
ncbi:MAG: hypothetical protein PVI42_19550 [Desulfobacterales bacterium]|jgi:hypothetical protein